LSLHAREPRAQFLLMVRCCMGWLIIAGGLLIANTAFGEPLNNLIAVLHRLADFSADFKQVTLDETGKRLQLAHGRLSISKPYRFRWHANPPMEQVLVSDGKLIWFYDPDLEQVTIRKATPDLVTLPILILAGNISKIDEQFLVENYQDETGDHFVFQPKIETASFRLVSLLVHDGQIHAIDITDALNQRTTIELSNIHSENNWPADTFQFHIQDGMDVIKEF